MAASTYTRSQGYLGRYIDQQIGWVKLRHKDSGGSTANYRWSEIPSAHGSNYLEGRLRAMGGCENALSDRDGRIESMQFDFEIADTDHLVRGWLGDSDQLAIQDIETTVEWQTMSDLVAANTPFTHFRGMVKSYAAPEQCFRFSGQDWLSNLWGQNFPLRRVGDDFTGAPPETRDRMAPVYYGAHTVDTSALAAPVMDDATLAVFGGVANLKTHGWYYTNLASYVAPSGVSVSAAAGGSLTTDGSFWGGDNRIGVVVTAVVGGVESDPSIFYFDYETEGRGEWPVGMTEATISPGNQTINVSWTGVGGATEYRVYAGWYYFGAIWARKYVVTAPTTSLSITSDSQGEPIAALPQYVYRVTTIKNGIESTPSDYRVSPRQAPYRRPQLIAWSAVAGSPDGYVIYRKALGPGQPEDLAFTEKRQVTSAQIAVADFTYADGLWTPVSGLPTAPTSSGVLPTIYVGTVTAPSSGASWHAFVVAGHACKSVDAVCQNGSVLTAGDDLTYPGASNYSTHFSSVYYDASSGYRYTIVYARGTVAELAISNAAPLRCNVKAIESTGDGSGTLLDNLIDQFAHVLDNYILPDTPYDGGAWGSTPTWGDGTSRRDTASFTTTATSEGTAFSTAAERKGAWGILQPQTVLDVVAKLAVSGDYCYGATRDGKLRVVLDDPDPSRATPVMTLDETSDIADGSFHWMDQFDVTYWFNAVSYAYQALFNDDGSITYAASARLDDTTAQALYGKNGASLIRYGTAPVTYDAVTGSAGSLSRARRLLARSSTPPRDIVLRTGMHALALEIGDVVSLTHGSGPGSSGYSAQPCRVRRMRVLPSEGQVELTLRQYVTATVTGTQRVGVAALEPLNASALLFGTVPDQVFPDTLPAVSGERLTGIQFSGLSGSLTFAQFPTSGTWALSGTVNITGTLQVNGSAVVTKSFMSTMVGFFPGGCPSGWTAWSSGHGKFLRMASSAGGTGGSDTMGAVPILGTATAAVPNHTHHVTHTSYANSSESIDDHDQDTRNVEDAGGNPVEVVESMGRSHTINDFGHRHDNFDTDNDGGGASITIDTSALETDDWDNRPAYYELVPCQIV